ncbi:MAG: glyoxylate/hydroxypyruvate reductase A [Pseudomonadota bacterium]
MALVFHSPLDDPEPWRRALASELPDLDVWVWPHVPDPAAIAFALVYRPPPALLASLKHVRAVVSLAAGVDHIPFAALPSGVPVCRMVEPGLAAQMADYVLHAALTAQRGFDHYARCATVGQWDWAPAGAPSAFHVGLLGLGAIGRAVAARLAAAGFSISGWSRLGRTIAGVVVEGGADGLDRLLARSDMVVLLLPATAETAGLVDARFLQRTKRGAHFVNVGRGEHVVDADLLRALDDGQLASATLDVFRVEPLPADHPFWRHPRVRVTPHVAATPVPETGAVAVRAVVDAVRNGLPLPHRVDLERGY